VNGPWDSVFAMRLVVTGAAGFVGSHLCEALLADGHVVVGIDVLASGSQPRARLELHRADVCAVAAREWLEGADAVLHLAGRPGAGVADEAALREANVTTTAHVVRCAAAAGVGRVVLASSSSVYGSTAGEQREDGPLMPQSPYARSKADAEVVARALARELA